MRALLLTCTTVALGGCMSEASFRSEMLPRAAFELSCPADQVTVTRLGDESWGVSGCGRKATYIYVLRVGYVNNTGVQTYGQAPVHRVARPQVQPPSPEDVVVVPLRVYMLRAHGDTSTAFAAEVPAVVDQLDHIFSPAGVYFTLAAPPQTIELGGEVPRGRAALASSVPAATDGQGFRLFVVRDLDLNGAGLGGADLVVREHPDLKPVEGAAGNPIARVAGHVMGAMLGLTVSTDERALMALGTAGFALDPQGAQVAHAAARRVRGAMTVGEAARAGVFPDAVAAIRARSTGASR